MNYIYILNDGEVVCDSNQKVEMVTECDFNPWTTSSITGTTIIYGNGLWIVGVRATVPSPIGKSVIWYNPDITNRYGWISTHKAILSDYAFDPQSGCYGSSGYMMACDNGSDSSVFYSPDGYNWSGTTVATGVSCQCSMYGNGVYVVTTSVGISSMSAWKSTNMINWTKTLTVTGSSSMFSSGVFDNGKFVIHGGSYIFSSTDGISWVSSTISSSFGSFFSLAYGNGRWLLGKDNTKIYYSTDNAVTWNTITPSGIASTTGFLTLDYINNCRFEASFTGGQQGYSTDGGNTWSITETTPLTPSGTRYTAKSSNILAEILASGCQYLKKIVNL